MLIRLHRVVLLLALLLFSALGYAQEEQSELGPLVTDRPDATESPAVVPKGFLQVETGFAFETLEEGDVKSEDFTLNTSLLRFGVLDNLELRLGWDLVNGKITDTKIPGSIKSNGLNPMLLGGKVAITKEENGWPEIGLLGHLYLPFTASDDYEPKYTGADLILSVGHTLSDRSSIGYNLGAEWGGDTTETTYKYTLAYGYGISDAFGFYLELYGNLVDQRAAKHFWDGGFTYLLSDSVQLDATVGSSLTGDQDLLISGGASFRIPLKKQSK